MKTLRLAACFVALAATSAFAAPQLSFEQASKIAADYLRSHGYAKEHFISALVLEPTTPARTKFTWIAKWSPAVELEGRQETGIEIAMDGNIARLVTKTAAERIDDRNRIGSRNIR